VLQRALTIIPNTRAPMPRLQSPVCPHPCEHWLSGFLAVGAPATLSLIQTSWGSSHRGWCTCCCPCGSESCTYAPPCSSCTSACCTRTCMSTSPCPARWLRRCCAQSRG